MALTKNLLILALLALLAPVAVKFLPVDSSFRYARSWLTLRAQTRLPSYTVRLKEELACAGSDGTVRHSVSGYYTNARRSDGSVAYDASYFSGVHRRTIKRMDGLHITVNNRIRTMSTYAINPVGIHGRQRSPESNCLQQFNGLGGYEERYDGEETLHGYRTVRTVSGGGVTVWYAPDLACAILQQRSVWPTRNGGEPSTTTKTVLSIEAGEPDGSLFHSPPDYDELAPSALAQRSADFELKALEPKMPADEFLEYRKKRQIDKSRYARADEVYWRNRPPRSGPEGKAR